MYIHTNIINNKKYVGLTSMKLNQRWQNGNNYKHSTYFYHAIQKYGWENFLHEVYANNLTADEAAELEQKLICELNTTDRNYGYNLDSGGWCPKHSEITKDKIRKKITGIKRSSETKEKLRQASKGNKSSVGRKHTDAAKEKNRQAHLGKTHVLTEEAKERIALSNKNRKEVICVELNITFPSIGLAAKYVKGSQGTISSVLCGTRKTAYGYHWQYK